MKFHLFIPFFFQFYKTYFSTKRNESQGRKEKEPKGSVLEHLLITLFCRSVVDV